MNGDRSQQKLDRKKIYDKYQGHCAYCGVEITMKQMHVDHVHPRFRGGEDDENNLNPSCRRCNSWKSAWTLEEFRKEISAQVARLALRSPGYRLARDFFLITETGEDVRFYFELKVLQTREKGNMERLRNNA